MRRGGRSKAAHHAARAKRRGADTRSERSEDAPARFASDAARREHGKERSRRENRGACPRTFWTALDQKRMDFVARSRLCAGEDEARLRTMRHERKDAATTREASEAKTPRLGSRRTRQDASMARSEAGERSETARRRRQATRIGDGRRGRAGRLSGRERRAAETGFSRCRKCQARLRFGPQRNG